MANGWHPPQTEPKKKPVLRDQTSTTKPRPAEALGSDEAKPLNDRATKPTEGGNAT